MPKIKVKDISLYYEEYSGEKGDPIVFISGFSGDHLMWSGLLKECTRNHRVIVFDNRGVGQSDRPDYPYTVDMMADDTAALCKELNVHKATFIGNSMGGFITQTLAYKYPDLTKAAIISNSVEKYSGVGFKLLLESQLKLIETRAPLDAIVKAGLGWCFSDKFLSRPGLIEFIVKSEFENKYPATAIGFKNQMHACLNFDASSWVHKINKPCLVIGSDEDKIFPENLIRNLSKLIPNAKYFCFEGGVGHVPCIEEPELFSKVILGFIDETVAG
ncbi:MAG: alpha/beta hydrolase [Gammaproteobacteria bacterium]